MKLPAPNFHWWYLDALASHGQLHSTSSRTKTPELPPVPVAYQIDALAPTHFGGCQRCFGVGGGGTENAIRITLVFRAILERRCVLESERGSAGFTREMRKQEGVLGVRLEPLPPSTRYMDMDMDMADVMAACSTLLLLLHAPHKSQQNLNLGQDTRAKQSEHKSQPWTGHTHALGIPMGAPRLAPP